MTRLRHVPPVHSPIPVAALGAGFRTVMSGDEGPRRRIADHLARRYGARDVLFTDSGTSALILALAGAAKLHGGASTVALPAWGCYDLVTAVQGAGARAVLYDLEPDTLSPEPDSLRRALRGADVLVLAHLYGVPVDLDTVRKLAGDAGALLLEDAAQGVGASFGGRPLGAHGSVSVLSFGRGKGLTGGGGGALLAMDAAGEEIVEAAGAPAPAHGRGARRVAAAAVQWALGRPWLYAIPASLPFLSLGQTIYRPPSAPRAAPEGCLAVLEQSWEASVAEAGVRRRHARRLLAALERTDDVEAVRPPQGARPGYLRLPVLARTDSARRRLSSPEARRSGVMPGYPEPLYRLEAYRDASSAGSEADVHPGAELLASSLFTLAVHSRMASRDVARIEEVVAPLV